MEQKNIEEGQAFIRRSCYKTIQCHMLTIHGVRQKKWYKEDDTEDEIDYQSLSDEIDVQESISIQSESDQLLVSTMAQLITQMQKDQQRRDEEQARRYEEQARRNEEHRMQMQMMTETLAKLQVGDPNREQTGARTKAKKKFTAQC